MKHKRVLRTPKDDPFTVQLNVANNIRTLREESGWSQRELAAAIQLPRHSILNIESGERHVRSHEFVQLADLFDIALDDLKKPATA